MSIRRRWQKFTSWVRRKDPPDGPGPGGGPHSHSYDTARAGVDHVRTLGNAGPGL